MQITAGRQFGLLPALDRTALVDDRCGTARRARIAERSSAVADTLQESVTMTGRLPEVI
jgi:hypothetical protein